MPLLQMGLTHVFLGMYKYSTSNFKSIHSLHFSQRMGKALACAFPCCKSGLEGSHNNPIRDPSETLLA